MRAARTGVRGKHGRARAEHFDDLRDAVRARWVLGNQVLTDPAAALVERRFARGADPAERSGRAEKRDEAGHKDSSTSHKSITSESRRENGRSSTNVSSSPRAARAWKATAEDGAITSRLAQAPAPTSPAR